MINRLPKHVPLILFPFRLNQHNLPYKIRQFNLLHLKSVIILIHFFQRNRKFSSAQHVQKLHSTTYPISKLPAIVTQNLTNNTLTDTTTTLQTAPTIMKALSFLKTDQFFYNTIGNWQATGNTKLLSYAQTKPHIGDTSILRFFPRGPTHSSKTIDLNQYCFPSPSQNFKYIMPTTIVLY